MGAKLPESAESAKKDSLEGSPVPVPIAESPEDPGSCQLWGIFFREFCGRRRNAASANVACATSKS